MIQKGQPLLRPERPEPTFLWAALALSAVINLGASLAFARRSTGASSSAGNDASLAQRMSAIESDLQQTRQRIATTEAGHQRAQERITSTESNLQQAQQRIAAFEQRPTTGGNTGLRRVVVAVGESGQSACLAIGGMCIAMESMSAYNASGHHGVEIYNCTARLRRARGNECSNGEPLTIPSIFYPDGAQGGFDAPVGNVDMCLRENTPVGAICTIPSELAR